MTVENFLDHRGEEARSVRRVKFKLHDKRTALVDLGRHLGMFVHKPHHDGQIEVVTNIREFIIGRIERLLRCVGREGMLKTMVGVRGPRRTEQGGSAFPLTLTAKFFLAVLQF